ncbi:hypothetical protein DASC09_028070 [Saccharomycopsis crataegensis]|uniref:Uncharacterized protein n=1 Tax=Saccharomycopsis crataegensis TaxID=43959 RepID=A0AAV5QLR4_9ASCO|nr:hypothetical protein DASC09_028070 [Saccharomycopsis crataegensis]
MTDFGERFRSNAILAINSMQKQHRAMKKDYNKYKGFLHIKTIYFKIVDNREVKRRLRAALAEEKRQHQAELDRQRKEQNKVVQDTSVFRINFVKLSNTQTEKFAKDIKEQTKVIANKIQLDRGGLFHDFKNYRKSNQSIWQQQKRQEKENQKEAKYFLEDEQNKEKESQKLHAQRLKDRFKIEVRDERIEKYRLREKRRLAKKLGYW